MDAGDASLVFSFRTSRNSAIKATASTTLMPLTATMSSSKLSLNSYPGHALTDLLQVTGPSFKTRSVVL